MPVSFMVTARAPDPVLDLLEASLRLHEETWAHGEGSFCWIPWSLFDAHPRERGEVLDRLRAAARRLAIVDDTNDHKRQIFLAAIRGCRERSW